MELESKMKTKDWIKELQKLDPEKELYFHYDECGEDWGYSVPTPIIEARRLTKDKYNGQWLIYDDWIEGKKLGLWNTVRI